MALRSSCIGGSSGSAELTATVQACVTLWEGALALFEVKGIPETWRNDAPWPCWRALWRCVVNLCS
jgi:hypothetical protein